MFLWTLAEYLHTEYITQISLLCPLHITSAGGLA